MRWTVILALLLMASPALADITGPATVIDGDTLEIGNERIRLHGIDAPESGQTCVVGLELWLCGQKADNALYNFIGASPVTCQERDVDRFPPEMSVVSNASDIASPAWAATLGSSPLRLHERIIMTQRTVAVRHP